MKQSADGKRPVFENERLANLLADKFQKSNPPSSSNNASPQLLIDNEPLPGLRVIHQKFSSNQLPSPEKLVSNKRVRVNESVQPSNNLFAEKLMNLNQNENEFDGNAQ